jgi:hypothetical protein
MLKTSLFINAKYYAMCGGNDGHVYSLTSLNLINAILNSSYLIQNKRRGDIFLLSPLSESTKLAISAA